MISWLKERRAKAGSGDAGKSSSQTDQAPVKNSSSSTKKQPASSEDEDSNDEEDDYVEDIPKAKLQQKKVQRSSVSAEAYGMWNKKGTFKPRVIPKNEAQKMRIAQRLAQAFMFSALDDNEKNIVIDAMEEKKFQYLTHYMPFALILPC